MPPRRSPNHEGVHSGEVLRFLIDAVEDYAICMLDASGHVETWNSGAERIFGYSADEIVGKHCSTFYDDSDLGSSRCSHDLENARLKGKFTGEAWNIRKDRTTF